jgi:hypothetical protein
VPYRVLEGGGWSHNWHKGCFWIQTSATGLCRFVPPHRPFLLAVNACHNGQPWLKGEQQTSWLTGQLLILWCLFLCNCLKSNILS